MHITRTLGPISLNDAQDSMSHLHLREGNLDIHFESLENLIAYKTMHIERAGVVLIHNFNNPTDECGTDWIQLHLGA